MGVGSDGSGTVMSSAVTPFDQAETSVGPTTARPDLSRWTAEQPISSTRASDRAD